MDKLWRIYHQHQDFGYQQNVNNAGIHQIDCETWHQRQHHYAHPETVFRVHSSQGSLL